MAKVLVSEIACLLTTLANPEDRKFYRKIVMKVLRERLLEVTREVNSAEASAPPEWKH